jgi:hypothetical protein
MSKLLVETNFIQYDSNIIAEARDVSRPLVLRNVVLQRANAKNQNGRVYPREILMKEVDHPESPVVNLRNVCANVTRIDTKGDDVVGDMQILSTPAGNIVRELVKNNIRLGVSSRGVGSVKNMDENTLEVQDDFNLICFDVVSNPSTHGAFINESVTPGQVQVLMNLDSLIHDFLSEVR